MINKHRLRLSPDSAQKILMLLLSGAELANQLIQIAAHTH